MGSTFILFASFFFFYMSNFYFCCTHSTVENIGFLAPLKVWSLKKSVLSTENGFLSYTTALEWQYIIELYIGTPYQTLSFHIDTGSDLTWVEALSCSTCFQRNLKLRFDQDESYTYKNLAYLSSLCDYNARTWISRRGDCNFLLEYVDGDWASGFVGTDVVSVLLDDDLNKLYPIPLGNFAFGLSSKSEMEHANYSTVSGTVGLSATKNSFLDQFKITRFSHCFHRYGDNDDDNFMRFGNQSLLLGSSVPFFTSSNGYSVPLYGISVGKMRLPIPDSFFKDTQTNGALIVDSGSTFTVLSRQAMTPLLEELQRQIGPQYDKGKNCFLKKDSYKWKYEEDLDPLPDIIFNMENFDFVLPKLGIYYCKKVECCIRFATNSRTRNSIIGVTAQINYNIGFDLTRKKLYFQQRDCP